VIDVRATLQTDDDALIYMRYEGYRHGPREVMEALAKGEPADPSTYYFRINADLRDRCGQVLLAEPDRCRRHAGGIPTGLSMTSTRFCNEARAQPGDDQGSADDPERRVHPEPCVFGQRAP